MIHRSNRGLRYFAEGVTLVELLIVVAIVLSVSLVVLRTLPPALESRNVREAARLVNVFFNTARGRALNTGRPAGVWIERMPGLPEASVSLYYAQIPEVFCGAYSDSEVEAFMYPNYYANPPTARQSASAYFANVVRPCRKSIPTSANNRAAWDEYYSGWGNPDPTAQKLINAGDLISFNNSKSLYRLDRITTSTLIGTMDAQSPLGTVHYWCIGISANKTNLSDTKFRNPVLRDSSGNTDMNPFLYSSNGAVTTPGSDENHRGRSVPFQIFRQPQRQASGGVTLPESAIIDLNYSGPASSLGNAYYRPPFNPRYVTNAIRSGTGTATTPAIPQNPYAGYMLDINGAPILPNAVNPNYDNTPIIIMFTPSGTVSQVYCRVWDPSSQMYRYLSQSPVGLIYLLIGKRDKVPAAVPISATGYTAATSAQQQLGNNWSDPTNLYVTINCFSGMVTTSPIYTYQNTAANATQTATVSQQMANTYSAYVGPSYLVLPSTSADALMLSRQWAIQGYMTGAR